MKFGLNENATLWKRSGRNFEGGYDWSSPESIKVRWESRTEVFVNSEGQEVRSEARVFVDRDLGIGDYLLLGTSSESDPTNVENAQEVREFRRIPSLKANKYNRYAFV